MIFNPLPIGAFRVTQSFGENPIYYKKYGLKFHNGTDFAPITPGKKGVVIYAPHEGYIQTFDQGNIGYGRFVQIVSFPYQKNRARKSELAHMEKFLVVNGQFISAGEPLGIMGTTGDSTGIHTHWTYKIVDAEGKTLNKDNGVNGAIDIAKYVQLWELGKHLK